MLARVLLPLAALLATPAAANWQQDFAALKTALARDYANFGHAVEVQRLDLAALAARAESELQSAPDLKGRQAAAMRLVDSFQDPHLAAFRTRPPGSASGPQPACATPAAPTTQPSGTPLAGAEAVEGRLLQTAAGRRIALLRIPTFVLAEFPACPAALRAAGRDPTAPCPDCDVEALVATHLDAALAAALKSAAAAGAHAIAIDVRGNPGGGDWAVRAARLLGAPAAARMALARSPKVEAWAAEQASRLAAEGKPEDAAIARSLQSEAANRCDLTPAWRAPAGTPLPCPSTTSPLLYAGDFATARDPAVQALPNRLPLFVLIDGETYSSAELFAAQLRDNGAARLVGQRTAGAGCGQRTGGGNALRLPALGLTLTMPDCVRLRADGSNERAGIAPDIIVEPGPGPAETLDRLLAALDTTLATGQPR